MHLNYLGQSYFGLCNPGNTGDGIRLAAEIGVDLWHMNAAAATFGYDPELGRLPRTLVPIGRSSYYAMEMRPCLYNTQGVPKRNSRAQILDVWGNPIKRVYSAGEIGSLWHRNFPGAGNVSEALAFGRIAGKNAAGEQPVTA